MNPYKYSGGKEYRGGWIYAQFLKDGRPWHGMICTSAWTIDKIEQEFGGYS